MVGWVSHVGQTVSCISSLFAAKAYPSNDSTQILTTFFQSNLLNALLFMLPHSLLTPKRIVYIISNSFSPKYIKYSRLLYNLIAAITLHRFLSHFRSLESPVLFTLPINETCHACTSTICLIGALACFVTNAHTYDILGFTNALNCNEIYKYCVKRSKNYLYQNTYTKKYDKSVTGMDIITWLGITVTEKTTVVGFIMFSGLSILPFKVTINDLIVRIAAAIYLRVRSKQFCKWIGKMKHVHTLIWCLRGSLFLVALQSISLKNLIFCALGILLSAILSHYENK